MILFRLATHLVDKQSDNFDRHQIHHKKTIKKNPKLTVQFQKWLKRAPWNKIIFNAIFVAWGLMLLTHNGILPNGGIRFVEISHP